jgi:hypothetical protein
MGVSKYLKEQNPAITIVGAQPAEGASIPGIRKWPVEYLPKIFDGTRVDRTESVTQGDAEDTARRLAREEGIFAGISAGGACAVALRISREVRDAISSSSSATAATATCRPACFPRDPDPRLRHRNGAGCRRHPAHQRSSRGFAGRGGDEWFSQKRAPPPATISRRFTCSRLSRLRARCATRTN